MFKNDYEDKIRETLLGITNLKKNTSEKTYLPPSTRLNVEFVDLVANLVAKFRSTFFY